jgi:hypothetical protein
MTPEKNENLDDLEIDFEEDLDLEEDLEIGLAGSIDEKDSEITSLTVKIEELEKYQRALIRQNFEARNEIEARKMKVLELTSFIADKYVKAQSLINDFEEEIQMSGLDSDDIENLNENISFQGGVQSVLKEISKLFRLNLKF